MPIQYAIASHRPGPISPEEQAGLEALGYFGSELNFIYTIVPATVAEADEEFGRYALFSHNGTKVSKWLRTTKSAKLVEILRTGEKKPGEVLKDSLQQDVVRGDYLLAHSHDYTRLELSQVVRNTQVKTFTENLVDSQQYGTDTENAVRPHLPETHIRIPADMMTGGTVIPELLEKRFALLETRQTPITCTVVDEETAINDGKGFFGYFLNGEPVTGWIPYVLSQYEQKLWDSEEDAQKVALSLPLTDIMGTDILLKDWVFTSNNHYNTFMLCRVIGFSEDKVRLVAYKKYNTEESSRGYRIFTLNWPKDIVKIPLTVI